VGKKGLVPPLIGIDPVPPFWYHRIVPSLPKESRVRYRIVTGVMLVFVVLLVLSSASTAKNESSCIICHTNEALLKRLCKVPELGSGEAQG